MMTIKWTKMKQRMDLTRLLLIKQANESKGKTTTKAGGKIMDLISMIKAPDVQVNTTREEDWRVKKKIGGVVSSNQEEMKITRVIGLSMIKIANRLNGIRIVSNIRTIAKATSLVKKMAIVSKRDGRTRGTTRVGNSTSNSSMMNLEIIHTTNKEITITINSSMDDQISISMGTKTDKTTNICRQTLLSTRWHNSSGPSKKRQVFMALSIAHSSIQHQSTLLMRANSKSKEISLKVMTSNRQTSSLNFRWNQLHLFLKLLLRILISLSPSSLERV